MSEKIKVYIFEKRELERECRSCYSNTYDDIILISIGEPAIVSKTEYEKLKEFASKAGYIVVVDKSAEVRNILQECRDKEEELRAAEIARKEAEFERLKRELGK